MDAVSVTSSGCSGGSFSDLLRPAVKKNPAKKINRWSACDVDYLVNSIKKGVSLDKISVKLARPVSSIKSKCRSLGLSTKRPLSESQINYILKIYPLFGLAHVSNKLRLSPHKITYFLKNNYPDLSVKSVPNPSNSQSIPKKMLPYHMVERAAVLDRDCPKSLSKVDDAVLLLYGDKAPSAPLLAIHLDDLLPVLEDHFNRRRGVVSGALLSGYKA